MFRLFKRFGGYLGDKEAEPKADTIAGWYRTEDMGYMSVGGNLIVIGRSKDVLNISGTKIHSTYIQNALKTHPSVLDAFVLPIPDDEFYQISCSNQIQRLLLENYKYILKNSLTKIPERMDR